MTVMTRLTAFWRWLDVNTAEPDPLSGLEERLTALERIVRSQADDRHRGSPAPEGALSTDEQVRSHDQARSHDNVRK